MNHFLRRSAILAAAVASALSSQMAGATTFTWDGEDSGTNTLWSNATNWTANSGTPSATSDLAVFNTSGIANAANTIATNLTLSKLTYEQDNSSIVAGNYVNAYTTTINRGVTLTLSAHPAANDTKPANANLLVMPATGATAGAGSGTIVKFVSDTSGSGTLGKLSIIGAPGAALNVSGRPGVASAFESFAILDLSALDSFSFSTAPSFTNSGFGVGCGNVLSADTGAYSGKIILATNNTIDANRIAIGAQNNAGTAGVQPVSLLVLGQTNNVNTVLTDGTFSGTFYVGADPAGLKDSSGGVLFRAGLTNPTLTVGTATGRNGFRLGYQPASTGHFSFGVIDTTTASAGADGTFNGYFTTMNIGTHSNGTATAGAGWGMLTLDKGTIDASAMVFSATTANSTAGSTGEAQLNLSGTGVVTVSGNIALGRRTHDSNVSESNGVITIDDTASLSADRIFVASNTKVNDVTHTGRVTGILNLNGGTVTTSRVQAGDDTAQLGTNVTRLVNFNGGTLKAKVGTAYAATFLQGMTAANIYAGGGTIDTNGENITINQALVAPADNGVQSVAINTAGSGYRVAPIVHIIGGGGTGATGVARINADGTLQGVTITNPGTGYTSAPTFQLVANAGTSVANMLVPMGGAAATFLTPVLAANTSGGITKTGAGILTLTNTNTYTGGTTVTGGALQLGVAGALPTGGALAVNGGTVDLNGNSPTVGALSGTSGSIRSNVAGAVTLTFGNAANSTYGALLENGSGTLGVLKQGAGTTTLSAANTYSGGTTVSGGTLVAGHSDALANGAITVGTAGTVSLQDGLVNGVRTPSLTINGAGKVDLNHNSLIIQNGGSGVAGQAATLAATAKLKTGLENGGNYDWLGAGIMSTKANTENALAGSALYGIGIVQNNIAGATVGDGTTTDATPGNEIYTTFKNRTVALNDTLIKYTYMGDADLDGDVTSTDYSLIDNGYGSGLSGWINGDFDYSGTIDSTDYALIDNSYGAQVGTLSVAFLSMYNEHLEMFGASYLESMALVQTNAVPEPSSLGLVALAGVGLMSRRRRRAR